jgi:hypothetical protein
LAKYEHLIQSIFNAESFKEFSLLSRLKDIQILEDMFMETNMVTIMVVRDMDMITIDMVAMERRKAMDMAIDMIMTMDVRDMDTIMIDVVDMVVTDMENNKFF